MLNFTPTSCFFTKISIQNKFFFYRKYFRFRLTICTPVGESDCETLTKSSSSSSSPGTTQKYTVDNCQNVELDAGLSDRLGAIQRARFSWQLSILDGDQAAVQCQEQSEEGS